MKTKSIINFFCGNAKDELLNKVNHNTIVGELKITRGGEGENTFPIFICKVLKKTTGWNAVVYVEERHEGEVFVSVFFDEEERKIRELNQWAFMEDEEIISFLTQLSPSTRNFFLDLFEGKISGDENSIPLWFSETKGVVNYDFGEPYKPITRRVRPKRINESSEEGEQKSSEE